MWWSKWKSSIIKGVANFEENLLFEFLSLKNYQVCKTYVMFE